MTILIKKILLLIAASLFSAHTHCNLESLIELIPEQNLNNKFYLVLKKPRLPRLFQPQEERSDFCIHEIKEIYDIALWSFFFIDTSGIEKLDTKSSFDLEIIKQKLFPAAIKILILEMIVIKEILNSRPELFEFKESLFQGIAELCIFLKEYLFDNDYLWNRSNLFYFLPFQSTKISLSPLKRAREAFVEKKMELFLKEKYFELGAEIMLQSLKSQIPQRFYRKIKYNKKLKVISPNQANKKTVFLLNQYLSKIISWKNEFASTFILPEVKLFSDEMRYFLPAFLTEILRVNTTEREHKIIYALSLLSMIRSQSFEQDLNSIQSRLIENLVIEEKFLN